MVLAPDSITFEDRRGTIQGIEPDYYDWLQHYNAMSYRLLDGDVLMRKCLDDAQRALSVLLQVSGLDERLVGVAGHSYARPRTTAGCVMGVCRAVGLGRWPEKRLAHLTRYLALAEMKFPIVLMEYNHPAQRLAPLWREQQSRNEITFESPVLDPFTKEPIEFLDVATPDFHRRRLRKSKAIAKHRGEVGHHPRMIVRNAACFTHKKSTPRR